MKYLSVRNWRRFQHYSDRSAPWLKLYRELQGKPEWMTLPDATKGHLVGLWLLAAELDNRIPDDPAFITLKIGASAGVKAVAHSLRLLQTKKRCFIEKFHEGSASKTGTDLGTGASKTGKELGAALENGRDRDLEKRKRNPPQPPHEPEPTAGEGTAGPRIPRCVQAQAHGPCNAELRREQARFTDSPTHGKGWRCPACKHLYLRDDRVIVRQLSDRARSALFQELEAEAQADREEQEARRAALREAEPPEARLARRLVATLRDQAGGKPDPMAGEWERVLAEVERRVNPHSFATWFRPTLYLGSVEDDDGRRLVIQVPTVQFREWLTANFLDTVAAAIAEVGLLDVGSLGVVYATADEAAPDEAVA